MELRSIFSRLPWHDVDVGLQAQALYGALPTSDSIRLFDLSPGCRPDELSGTLRAARLSDRPSYFALSYVWGQAKSPLPLKCSGHSIDITASLEQALLELRLPTDTLTLWVDALCINQQNVVERNFQVKLMSEVYKNAAKVIVWLGSSIRCSKTAFSAAKQLTELEYDIVWKPGNSPEGCCELLLKNPTNEDDILKYPSWLKDHRSAEFDALKELTYVKWFHRAWTTQEIGSATRATFVSGDDRIDWEVLYRAYGVLQKRVNPVLLYPEALFIERVTSLYRSFSEGQSLSHQRQGSSFVRLLSLTRSRACSEPRDRIFALLSHPFLKDPSTGKSFMEVDYRKSLQTIYKEVAHAAIIRGESLDILSYAYNRLDEKSRHWPSWIPLWHRELMIQPLLGSSGMQSCNASGKHELKDCSVATDLKQPILQVAAFAVDKIAWCTEFRISRDPRYKGWLVTEAWGVNPPTPRNIMFSRDESAEPMYKEAEATFTAWLSCFTGELPVEQGQSQYRQAFPPVRGQQSTPTDPSLRGTFEKALRGRKIFRTTKGILGIGPRTLSVGDHLFVICGGKVPYVLRSEGTKASQRRFQLVGECYAHGLMMGEIEVLEPGWGLVEQVIKII